MNRIKKFMKKGWVKRSMRIIKIYRFHILFIVFLVIVLSSALILSRPLKFTSPNSGYETDTQTSTALNLNYTYYLDISPTMYGYINTNSGLRRVSQILETINQNENTLFYVCSDFILSKRESEFYKFMEDINEVNNYYSTLVSNGGLAETIDGTALSKIFTEIYDNSGRFAGDGSNVNIIITDLNFYRNSGDESFHNLNLENFGAMLAGNILDANICIYCIRSQFDGFLYDEYSLVGDTTTIDKASFFVIVLSENNEAYDMYINKLEEGFTRMGIDFSNQYELKNDILMGVHEIIPDLNLFMEDEPKNRLINLNRNSKYFRDADKNALGVQIVENSSGRSAIQFAITQIELSGYYGKEEKQKTNIETQVQMYDAKLVKYEECTDISGITNCNGNIRMYDGKWYLCLDLEFAQDFNGQVNSSSLRKYCVLDILFRINRPGISYPSWVEELDENTSENNIFGKRNLLNLVERISESKANYYQERRSEYQKHIGSIRLYINY